MKETTANSARTGDIGGGSSVFAFLSSQYMVSWSNSSISMAFTTFHMLTSPKHTAIESFPAPDTSPHGAPTGTSNTMCLKPSLLSHSHPSICFSPHIPSLEKCHHSQLVVENRNLSITLTVYGPLFQCNSTV